MNALTISPGNSLTSNLNNPLHKFGANFHILNPPREKGRVRKENPDSILKVYDLIDKGIVKNFFVEDFKQPAVSWLQRTIDWLIGWGEFSKPEDKKTSEIKRGLLSNDKSHNCSYLTDSEVACLPINTGLNIEKIHEGECFYQNPIIYTVHLSLVNGAIDSTIQNCIKTWILACEINCLGCQEANGYERTQRLGTNTTQFSFLSDFYENRLWNVILTAPEDIYAWKEIRISETFRDIIVHTCEWQESYNNDMRNLGIRFGTFGAIVVCALIGCGGIKILRRCKEKQQNENESLIPDKKNFELKTIKIKNVH